MSGPFAHASSDHTVLAFDFGTRRLGVAVGNTLVCTAHPLATIDEERAHARFAAISALIDEWAPGCLVVGLPVHADGSEHALTSGARRFARQLEGRFGVPVVLVDERFTSEEAKMRLSATGRGGRRHRAERDAVAAQVILEAYFHEHSGAA